MAAAAFPPPPVNTIDWSNVGFRVREVNGHIESHYSQKTGNWSPLKFVTDPFIRIHGMAPALNYGQTAYEGLKAFRTPSGDIQVFRPDRNAARMQHSAEFISCPPVPNDLFVDAVKAAVSLNAEYVPPHETGAAMYIRPQIYGSSAQLGLNPPEEYMFCVYVLPTGVYHGTHPVNALILDEFDRAAPNGTGSAKVGGNYAPVLRWSERARNQGFGITLHLDSASHSEIDEFSTSGFIGAIKNGEDVTLVVPDSKAVIDSVTSDSIQELGRSFGWKVEKRSVSTHLIGRIMMNNPRRRSLALTYTDIPQLQIKYGELPQFSEVMAAGTAAALVPIRSITRRVAPTTSASITSTVKEHARLSSDSESEKVTFIEESQEDADPICLKLLTQLKAIQQGKAKDQFGWNAAVSAADGSKVEGVPSATNGNGQTVDQMD
ncbi:branched-chain amino acid aminotransferase [Apiospora hydei]|uniref:Branched-chain amino acid aminotransferase n=1 Tax=Apiospora hydei TaxID=1337664 RepID=A0ABR1X0W3_9PEZI